MAWSSSKALLDMPDVAGLQALAQAAVSTPLQVLASNRRVALNSLQAALETWRTGEPLPRLSSLLSKPRVLHAHSARTEFRSRARRRGGCSQANSGGPA